MRYRIQIDVAHIWVRCVMLVKAVPQALAGGAKLLVEKEVQGLLEERGSLVATHLTHVIVLQVGMGSQAGSSYSDRRQSHSNEVARRVLHSRASAFHDF